MTNERRRERTHHLVQGRLPGVQYVRVVRSSARDVRQRKPVLVESTEAALQPKGAVGQAAENIRRVLIGARLRSEMEVQERTGRLKGLAIFASDNISSSAYATEEVIRVLVLAGVGALALTVPIALGIALILAIVVASYRQVILAYPNGGGSYIVALSNLGPLAGLTAGAALLTDYILTVAVSTSAGVAAITSAFPELFAQRVLISVIVIAVMTVLNLRGIRESGTIFAAPTYIYVVGILGLLAVGLFRMASGTPPTYTAPPAWLATYGVEPLSLFLVLRAFASGSVALTGTEAVSNGVPAFKPPEVKNAQIVLVMMGTIFATIFIGISLMAMHLGIVPDPSEEQTVVSQLARSLVGGSSPYYFFVQFATAVLLVLAANTAFNGFPRLASILAEDRYLPRQFHFRGDRLAFTVGIVALAAVSSVLVVAYQGSVTGLIPLYTVGVFIAFTLSQIGMVRHWSDLRHQESGWRLRAITNGLGAMATGLVAVVVTVAKFALGAWMILILIPVLIGMMWMIQRHYREVEHELAVDRLDLPASPPRPPHVIVPVSRLDRAAIQALSYARSIATDVTAVHVTDELDGAEKMKQRWEDWGGSVKLVIIQSPYRALIAPLLDYIDTLDQEEPERPITVVLAEFVPRHFWEYFLHNQTALRLKLNLFFRPNTIVVDVPYHIEAGTDVQW